MAKGRGAKKVPNVKLKPAPKASTTSSLPNKGVREEPEELDDADHDESEDRLHADNVGRDKRPYVGVSVCCSGIDNKTSILQKAAELGAMPFNDFTDQITHLIADKPGSPKYKCAIKRNIPVVRVTWVTEAYATWRDGGDVSLKEHTIAHALPPFEGLRICITGLEDLEKRLQMAEDIRSHGGIYTKELSTEATHLVVCSETALSSEKVKWVQQTNRNRNMMGAPKTEPGAVGKRKQKTTPATGTETEGMIHLVWLEWLMESMRAGGCLDELAYDIKRSKSSSFLTDDTLPPPSFLSSHTSTPLPYPPPPAKRKRTSSSLAPANEAQEEEKFLARPAHSKAKAEVWADIQRSQKLRIEKTEERKPDVESETEDEGQIKILTADECKKPSLSIDTTVVPQPRDRISALSRLNSSRALSFADRPPPPAALVPGPSRTDAPKQRGGGGVFQDLKLRALGDADTEVLTEAVASSGGSFVRANGEADYIIVRLGSASACGSMWTKDDMLKIRTECWLERCMFEQKILPADGHFTFRPLHIPLPVQGAHALKISFSGLDLSELTFAKRLAKAVGAQLPDKFSRVSTTHLVCPGRSGAKFDRAESWGIPVVDLEWLWDIGRSGRIGGSSVDVDMDEMAAMTDITNESSEGSSRGRIPIASVTPASENPLSILSAESIPDKPLIFGMSMFDSLLPHSSSTPVTPQKISEVKQNIGKGKEKAESPFRQLDIPRSSHTPNSPSKTAGLKRKSELIIPSSETPSPITATTGRRKPPSTTVAKTLAVLLENHMLEDGEAPKKKMRPSSRLKRVTSGNVAFSASGSPSSSGLAFPPGAPPFEQGDQDTTSFPQVDQEESMRIVYDDPAGRAERTRLMSLVEGTSGSAASIGPDMKAKSSKGSGSRRSQRMAGF